MADSMKDHGYEYTAFQLNEKFKSLKRTYESLKAKSKIYEVGSKSMWEYYEVCTYLVFTRPFFTFFVSLPFCRQFALDSFSNDLSPVAFLTIIFFVSCWMKFSKQIPEKNQFFLTMAKL